MGRPVRCLRRLEFHCGATCGRAPAIRVPEWRAAGKPGKTPLTLSQIGTQEEIRFTTGSSELDRVLGGGR
jgi:predicted ATP-dependent serine protease